MRLTTTATALAITVGIMLQSHGCAMAPLSHRGGIQVDRWAEVKADDKTVADILATFQHAENALELQNLDELMNLYSQDYQYHGLGKEDLRKIWSQLFAHYRALSSNHIFSRIALRSDRVPVAEITCTGSLYGISQETGERENVDSWYGEVHYLVYQDGAWRIRGHAGAPPKALQFGIAPHPFF
jgi:hypothetical protein